MSFYSESAIATWGGGEQGRRDGEGGLGHQTWVNRVLFGSRVDPRLSGVAGFVERMLRETKGHCRCVINVKNC